MKNLANTETKVQPWIWGKGWNNFYAAVTISGCPLARWDEETLALAHSRPGVVLD